MGNFIIGAIFGIVVSTIGVSGVVNILDKVVTVTKAQAVQINK